MRITHQPRLMHAKAAQAAEPELLIPISVVLPGTQGDISSSPATGLSFGSIRPSITPQLVLCGDPNQCEDLPPGSMVPSGSLILFSSGANGYLGRCKRC